MRCEVRGLVVWLGLQYLGRDGIKGKLGLIHAEPEAPLQVNIGV